MRMCEVLVEYWPQVRGGALSSIIALRKIIGSQNSSGISGFSSLVVCPSIRIENADDCCLFRDNKFQSWAVDAALGSDHTEPLLDQFLSAFGEQGP
jgi:hypothetical protein